MAVEHFFSTLATVNVDHKGHISQDFDQLEQINSFRMRKTFWQAEFKTCHGQVGSFLETLTSFLETLTMFKLEFSGEKRNLQLGIWRHALHYRPEVFRYEQV